MVNGLSMLIDYYPHTHTHTDKQWDVAQSQTQLLSRLARVQQVQQFKHFHMQKGVSVSATTFYLFCQLIYKLLLLLQLLLHLLFCAKQAFRVSRGQRAQVQTTQVSLHVVMQDYGCIAFGFWSASIIPVFMDKVVLHTYRQQWCKNVS